MTEISGKIRVVDLLIRKGAFIYRRGDNGMTPLHVASREGISSMYNCTLNELYLIINTIKSLQRLKKRRIQNNISPFRSSGNC